MTINADVMPYPVQFSVDYPERPLNRLTTGLRIFVAIPILILVETVSGGRFVPTDHGDAVMYGAGGILFFGPLLMILFRQKYPRWWFDWNLELQRFSTRVAVFLALMDDRYPSTDEQQSVRLDYEYPDATRPQPVVAPGEVVPRDSALHRAVLSLHRDRGRGGRRMVRHPLHRPISPWPL
jgi:hypothetical protein